MVLVMDGDEFFGFLLWYDRVMVWYNGIGMVGIVLSVPYFGTGMNHG